MSAFTPAQLGLPTAPQGEWQKIADQDEAFALQAIGGHFWVRIGTDNAKAYKLLENEWLIRKAGDGNPQDEVYISDYDYGTNHYYLDK